MKKIIIIVLAILVLVTICYGFYNAYQLRTYAKDVQIIFAQSNDIWTYQKIKSANYTEKELADKFAEIKNDSTTQLAKLNQLKPPRIAKEIENLSKEYFTIAQNVTSQLVEINAYQASLQKAQNISINLTTNLTDNTAIANYLEEKHQELSKTITEIKQANIPEALKTDREKFVICYDKIDEIIVQAVDYYRNNQTQNLESLTKEYETARHELNSINFPDTGKIMPSLITSNEENKLETYPDKIKKEADMLAKKFFAF